MSSATGSSATRPGALGSNIRASSATVSRSSNVTGIPSITRMQNLPWVQLEFETIEDKNVFEAALDALKRQHGPHLGEEKLHPNHQSSKEQESLTRKYESAAVDAGNMMPTVVQKGDDTEITPSYKAKAEEGDFLAPPPHSPPALVGDSSSHIGERPDILAFVAGRVDPFIELDNRKRSSSVSDDGQQRSIRPSIDKAIRGVDPNLRLLDGLPRPRSLQCPFHFLGCKREFHIWRERQWVKHSLTHFQTQGARRFPVRKVEPPRSCRCYFCKTKFSSLSGTACWKDYMDHVRHCGIGHRRVPPDAILIEHLWQEDLINGETYQDLMSTEHPPIPIFETNLAEGPALIESESSASSVSETSECEEQSPRSETRVSRKIQRASTETSAKQEQWRRRICQKMILFMLWKREQDVSLPDELWSSPASFEFINVLEMSRLDKIKGLFETYSGREWDWWPFSAPAKPLESGKLRIRWQCVGELNSINTSTSANGLRPVANNAGPMHRDILPRGAKRWLTRMQQLGMNVPMPHLSQRAQPLVTHKWGASSQGRSPATPHNQPETPLICVPQHKSAISRIPTATLIRRICMFSCASTRKVRSSTPKSSRPNAKTMKPSSKISDKNTAASGGFFASGSPPSNSPIANS